MSRLFVLNPKLKNDAMAMELRKVGPDPISSVLYGRLFLDREVRKSIIYLNRRGITGLGINLPALMKFCRHWGSLGTNANTNDENETKVPLRGTKTRPFDPKINKFSKSGQMIAHSTHLGELKYEYARIKLRIRL
jgi:hypothetical protein